MAVKLKKIVSNIVSDWLTAKLPANQKLCLKILINQNGFLAWNVLSEMVLSSFIAPVFIL